MVGEEPEVTAIFLQHEGACVMQSLDSDTAITLIALLSEDPDDWTEAKSVWPRYRTPAVAEFVDSLPTHSVSLQEGLHEIEAANSWIALDFVHKRVLTGGQFMTIEHDNVFAMHVDEAGDHHCPLSVHLPPWWELLTGVAVEMISQERQQPWTKPHVDRTILFGDPLLDYIAANVLQVVQSEQWLQESANDQPKNRYPFTVQVHRDWLMTPREDLDGRMPRQMLHGARGWVDKVIWGQRRRREDGEPLVAMPDDWPNYQTAPMGTEEVSLYFDLCRELIQAGWFWCSKTEQTIESDKIKSDKAAGQHSKLVSFLKDVRDSWLESSFEGGNPPSFIIECERRRVPRGVGVPIEGIDGVETEQHVMDCDCPICEMMADGAFGITFTGIDGYHLELDEEFAFSLYETREEWEEHLNEFASFSEIGRFESEADETDEATDPEDEFPSVWSGINTTDDLPGDQNGTLKIAFMIAEVISTLKSLDAPHESVQQLNQLFSSYRRNSLLEKPEAAVALQEYLQALSETYPELISMSADLQSQIDDILRTQQ